MATTPIEQAQDDYFTLTDSIPQGKLVLGGNDLHRRLRQPVARGQTRLEHLCRPVATDVSPARLVSQLFTKAGPLIGRLSPALLLDDCAGLKFGHLTLI